MNQYPPIYAAPLSGSAAIASAPNTVVLGFKLAEDCSVRVEFTGTVTQEAIEKFMKLLDISLDLPSQLNKRCSLVIGTNSL